MGGYFDTANLLAMLRDGVSFCIPEEKMLALEGARPVRMSHNPPEAVRYLQEKLKTGDFAPHFRKLTTKEANKATISPIVILPKSNKIDWRAVYDMSCRLRSRSGATLPSLNEHTCREGLASVPVGTASREIDMICVLGHIVGPKKRHRIRMMKLDLKHAFYGILLRSRDQLLAAFQLDEEVWAHLGLPMGSIGSPSWYGRFMMMVWVYTLRVLAAMTSIYVDDIFILGVDGPACAIDARDVRALLKWAGWETNDKKCSTEPQKSLESLGNIFHIADWTVEISRWGNSEINGLPTGPFGFGHHRTSESASYPVDPKTATRNNWRV
jgi:hypothetical protein